MKYFILIMATAFVCNLTAQKTYVSNDNTHLWGAVDVEHLQQSPYLEWYEKSLDEYHPEIKKSDYQNLKDVKVKIFLGTWCGDTKNFLPKFIKVWEEAALPMSNLELIAVHNDTELYKQGPNHEEEAYGLHRVPTFIFQRNGEEIARIVEKPKTSLTSDIAQIAAGYAPKNSYSGVSSLQSYFASDSANILENVPDQLLNDLYNEVSYVGELTTYAKKLDTEGKELQAEYVYRLNTTLYRYHPYSHYRLGLFFMQKGQHELAKESFYKTSQIKPDYMNTCKYLVELKEVMIEQ